MEVSYEGEINHNVWYCLYSKKTSVTEIHKNEIERRYERIDKSVSFRVNSGHLMVITQSQWHETPFGRRKLLALANELEKCMEHEQCTDHER